MKPNGIIVYEGPSKFDGKKIVCIVTGTAKGSKNSKTGDMLQTWIIRQDVNPYSAWVTGKDKSVCGTCKHRIQGTCYINKSKGVYQVFKAYKRGVYPTLDCYNVDSIKGKMIRFGSYGDPAAVPVEVWETLARFVDGFTGYTHAWRHAENLKPFCMASVDSIDEQKKAVAQNWRTFRVRTPYENIANNEFKCPASLEAGRKTHCNNCKACSGLSSKIQKNVVIISHGLCRNKFNKIMTLRKNHKKISHLFMKKS